MRHLLIGMAVLTAAWGASAQTPGDVNGSGTVELTDAEMLIDHLLDVNRLDATEAARADCNSQAGLDAGDVVWILNNLWHYVPGMVTVPAGPFDMGDPWNVGIYDERPVHTVTLSAYEIASHEVTNAQYAAFLNSALASGEITVTDGVVYLTENATDPLFTVLGPLNNSQIEYTGGMFSVRVRDGFPMDQHPVTMVSWYGAAAHCNWLSAQASLEQVYTESGNWTSDLSRNGFHLPTEAQWERAGGWDPTRDHHIAGGHWSYPITDDFIDETRANYSSANPLGLTTQPLTSPVGHYTDWASPAGCYDMAGNVGEWCHDWYDDTYYDDSPSTDPEGPEEPQSYRAVRSSSWIESSYPSRSSSRNAQSPPVMGDTTGFRVARAP